MISSYECSKSRRFELTLGRLCFIYFNIFLYKNWSPCPPCGCPNSRLYRRRWRPSPPIPSGWGWKPGRGGRGAFLGRIIIIFLFLQRRFNLQDLIEDITSKTGAFPRLRSADPPSPPSQKEPTIRFFEHTFLTILRWKNV